jgi:60 kDa SS-A/Ro ribonucleoprotein
MVWKNLFSTLTGRLRTDARNSEGAPAYAFSDKHALAQLAATGCLGSTFYVDAETQLDAALKLARELEPEFLAKAAVYARERGHMKDLPALLCALLTVRGPEVLEKIFARVIDTPRMLRTFVQIVRSGATGRRSFGSRPRRLIRAWLAARTPEDLFRADQGDQPSLADIVRMVHPKPDGAERSAFYAWLLDRPHEDAALPALLRDYLRWKAKPTGAVPDLPYVRIAPLLSDAAGWRTLAARCSWQTTRMNLNTFQRHGVFEDRGLTRAIAARLADKGEVSRARAFPYQLLAAHRHAAQAVPAEVRASLATAMEHALANVPCVEGQVVVCVDVSGSMQSPVTGERGSATTAVRCVDVAALVGAAIVRANPRARVLPFAEDVRDVCLDAEAGVLGNAETLSSLPSGGTDCSAPLRHLNATGALADLVVFVSDNESWLDATVARKSAVLEQWEAFRRRNRQARLVCIDLTPNTTTQAPDRPDVLNVGGFSDEVFSVLADFAREGAAAGRWVARVEATTH